MAHYLLLTTKVGKKPILVNADRLTCVMQETNKTARICFTDCDPALGIVVVEDVACITKALGGMVIVIPSAPEQQPA